MNAPHQSHPRADHELVEAARWYEGEKAGLGDDFLDAANEAVEAILAWPLSAPAFPGWCREPVVRSKRIKRFPYRVLYFVSEDHVLTVVAYAHNRRKPGYWMPRLVN